MLASAIVTAATRRGLALEMPDDVREVHGYGLEGTVGDHRVRLGKAAWIVGGEPPAWVRQVRRRADLDGSLTVFVAVDDEPAGAFLLEDPIRPDAPRMVRALREAGITRVVLVTGDRADIADMVGRIVGVDTVLADCDPADKLAAIERESAHGATIMVGDGVNDAPALAAAGAGVALAARGATASSEAADVVLTVDRVDALADAILIARRSKGIALQAVLVGMGLSLVAMVAAAAGLLPPAAGAILQEVIDVLAIGIALRAVLPGAVHTIAMPARGRRHRAPAAGRARRGAAGDRADPIGGRRAVDARLRPRPGAHVAGPAGERAAPARAGRGGAARPPGGPSARRDGRDGGDEPHARRDRAPGRPAAAASRRASTTRPSQPEDVVELRRLLYGLYAVLRLHNAQEEEGAFSLVPNGAAIGQPAAIGAGGRVEPAPAPGSRSGVNPGTDVGPRGRAE